MDDLSLLCSMYIACGIAGLAAGWEKDRAGTGIVLGLVLGPLGVLVAVTLAPSPAAAEREMRARLQLEARLRAEFAAAVAHAASAPSAELNDPFFRPTRR